MKSRGTAEERVAEDLAAQFDPAPRIFLLATAIAPALLEAIDDQAVDAWIQALRDSPATRSVDRLPTPEVSQVCLAVVPVLDELGRYAASCDSIVALARAEQPASHRLAIGGVPVVEVAIARALSEERAWILPWIVLGLAAVLFGVYRHPSLVLAGLLSPLLGTLLLEGIQGWWGWGVDPVSALLGPTVLTVGVASSVHLIERTRRLLREGHAPAAATRRAARALRMPMALTVLTTAAGFLGLGASPIPAVVRFGWLACVGILIVVSATLFYLPPLLRILPLGRSVHAPAAAAGRNLPPHNPRSAAAWATALCVVLFLAGALEMQGTRVDSDPLQVLPTTHPVRQDAARFTQHLGGSETFSLLLPAQEDARHAAALGLLASVSSMDGVVGPSAPPQRAASGAQLLSFLLAPATSAERIRLFDHAEELARAAGWPQAHATGLSVRMTRDSQALIAAQRRGVLATAAALFLVMAIGFRSLWLGFLGLIPNLLPLVVLQGALAWLDQPLTVASSMIGVVMLGLVVDDTIHLLHAFREARGSGPERTDAALQLVRRPIVITTSVLCVGFAATALGSLEATREFGLLAVATLVLALLADLYVLPLLLAGGRAPAPHLQASESLC